MKTFILGLGAQKCGTSWLHDYLSGLDDVDLGFAKEYRTFAPYPPAVQFRRRLRALLHVIAANLTRAPISRKTQQARFLLNRRNYFDYFQRLLKQSGVTATGDMTPAYSGLQAPTLRKIRDRFARRGITVRPVFLMRDPVERCWSALRMERRNFLKRPDRRKGVTAEQMAMSEEEHLLSVYRTPKFAMRTRYDLTVTEIEKAFDPAATTYALFEELFTEGTVKRLCVELGLSYKPPPLERPVNVSEKNTEINDATKAEIAHFYAPVYAFAAERFGADAIRRLWPNYRFVV